MGDALWAGKTCCVSGPMSPGLEAEEALFRHSLGNMWVKILEKHLRPAEAEVLGLGTGKFHRSENPGPGQRPQA